MRILVDENVPLMTVDELRKLGHDVRDIRRSEDEGLLDTELLEIAQREKRLLITTDKGFGYYRDAHHSGILIIRLRQPNRYRIHKRVMLALTHFPDAKWEEMIVTMRDKTMNVIVIKK